MEKFKKVVISGKELEITEVKYIGEVSDGLAMYLLTVDGEEIPALESNEIQLPADWSGYLPRTTATEDIAEIDWINVAVDEDRLIF